jgi:DNA-binding CsgD family transcriptional regulator
MVRHFPRGGGRGNEHHGEEAPALAPVTRLDGDWFVGRRAQLEQILAQTRRVHEGLRTVLVSGQPGLGKTALLHRAASELAGFTVLWAIGDSWESEVPYGVVSQLVSLARVQYRAKYPLLFGPGGAEASPHQVGTELVDLVGDLDARRPVAMIVDDLQAADPNSLRALAFAVRRLRNARALLIAAARPSGADSQWRQMLPVELEELQLAELEHDEVMRLARRHGMPWLPPKRLDWLTRYTGGHPLYLRELLAEVDKDRLLADTGSSVTAPGSVVTAIDRQLHTLPPPAVLLLEALAVLDSRYPLAVVARLAGVADPDEAIVPLLAENLVRSWPHMPSTPVCIRYPIQRDAVYELIAPNRRRQLHTAALSWSHGRAAWVHRVAASDRIDGRLAAELEGAAQGVLREGRPARAATFLLWAADLSGHPADRELRTLRAAAHLLWNYRFRRAEALYGEVENAADSPLRRCLLGRYSTMRGWFSAAENALRGALTDPGDDEDAPWVRMLAATGLASLYTWQGRGADTAASAREAFDGEELHPELGRLARQYLAVAVLHTAGAPAAIDDIDGRLGLPERAGGRPAYADAIAWRCLMRGLAGQFSAAVDDADAVVRLMEAGQVADVEVTPQYGLAWAQYHLGQWEDAAANAEHAASLAVAEGKSWAHACAHMIAAMVAACRGQWEAAEAAVAETGRWVRTLGPPQYVVFGAMAGAALGQARGDHRAVLRALRPLTELVEVTGWPLAYEPWWRIPAVEAMIATGRLDEAAPAVDRLSELAGELPVLRPVVARLAGSLAAARGDEATALGLLSGAVDDGTSGATGPVRDGSEVDDLPLHRALLEQEYGQLLVRAHQWRAGFNRLQQARRQFLAIGAAPYAERCARLLAASGVLPGQRDAGPLTLLTERERAIAELVARGLTNHEVAARLFISAKTVSHHLGRIFAKLDIGSRRELRTLLGAPDSRPPHSG